MDGSNSRELESDLAGVDPRQQALRIGDLSPGDQLVIRTEHSVYHLAVIEPATRQVVLSGGPFFPNPVGVHLDGCSLAGRFIEIGAICIGCSLEFRTGTGTVVTGLVRSIGVVHHG